METNERIYRYLCELDKNGDKKQLTYVPLPKEITSNELTERIEIACIVGGFMFEKFFFEENEGVIRVNLYGIDYVLKEDYTFIISSKSVRYILDEPYKKNKQILLSKLGRNNPHSKRWKALEKILLPRN